MRVRLELNNSGAWKLLGVYEGNTPGALRVQEAAGNLADALNDPASGRHALCRLRVSTDEVHPRVLAYHDGGEKGWRHA